MTWPGFLSGFGRDLAEQIRAWARAEVAPGRLVPWLPVAFGLGVAVYFSAEREPAAWAAVSAAALFGICAVAARRRPIAFPLALGLAAIAAGFAIVTLKSAWIGHPILRFGANVELAGYVEVREERERADRIVVRVHRMDGARLAEKPERVRISVRKGTAPPVGSFVELKARLSPPLAPLRPGGYDFGRDLYFQQIGASGFALGQIKLAPAPQPPGAWLRYATAIEGLRDAIDSRIRSVLKGDAGSIASALITGKRDAISAPVNDSMYVSSLAHVLSISGYHMAVVAGVEFFIIRAGLALVPGVAARHPIKKWAALGALAAAAFYLLLSGAEVATQRSFIMIAIVLVAVLIDRRALTLRTLTLAALGVMLLAPEAVVHPSFQMSFAATLALISAYERGLPWMISGAETSVGARVALWGGREIIALILASLVAGLATTPYAAYHFHRLAPYGVLANLLAMPIVSAWVMPCGLLALVALPFGLDGALWQGMGLGIDWMIKVALWVASLPGALGRIPAFGVGPLLLGTGGLIVVCLLRTPLRWCGAIVLVLAAIWAVRTPQPDVLIAGDGQTFGVRAAAGRLAIAKIGNDTFATREWLAADADPRTVKDATLKDGLTCDQAGCIGRLGDGTIVAIALSPAAFEEDCRRAALVLSPRQGPAQCDAVLVDRGAWRAGGAVALRRAVQGFDMIVARPPGYERPWTRAPGETGATPVSTRPAPRDATPRADDLDPGD